MTEKRTTIKDIYHKLNMTGWADWEEILDEDEKDIFRGHLWAKEKRKEPPCGLCAFCQELKFLEYDDEDNYIGPALKYMCVNKESKKVFQILKHGASEFRCNLWKDING